MKRILCAVVVLTILVALTACSLEVPAIEDHEWKMRKIMKNCMEVPSDSGGWVVAVGAPAAAYPEAEILNLTLLARYGIITVTNETKGRSYAGNYRVLEKTNNGTHYEVTIDGVTGYATVATTVYDDGMEVPTLPINLGDYSLYFVPVS